MQSWLWSGLRKSFHIILHGTGHGTNGPEKGAKVGDIRWIPRAQVRSRIRDTWYCWSCDPCVPFFSWPSEPNTKTDNFRYKGNPHGLQLHAYAYLNFFSQQTMYNFSTNMFQLKCTIFAFNLKRLHITEIVSATYMRYAAYVTRDMVEPVWRMGLQELLLPFDICPSPPTPPPPPCPVPCTQI